MQGHVDNVATFASVEKSGDSYALRIFVPQALRQYVVEKGSITFDGISLTVNELHDDVVRGNQSGFEVGLTIIPHTWDHTNLSSLTVGTRMNVEVDVLSKYVENLLRFSPTLGKVAS